jgi:hypothetical protein
MDEAEQALRKPLMCGGKMVPRDSVQQSNKFKWLERGGAENSIAVFLLISHIAPLINAHSPRAER